MSTHVIVFPNTDEYGRAIMAFLDVYIDRVALPGLKMVVSKEHIDALQRAEIKYQDITKVVPNGAAPVQP